MKKLLLALALVPSLLFCACAPQVGSVQRLIDRFLFEIKKELGVEEGDDNWCYTYQEVYPKSTEYVEAYIIDFYLEDRTSTHSKWMCLYADNYVDCDLLYMTYF